MKIILLCDSLIKGGRERRLIELIRGLSGNPEVSLELILFKNLIEYPIIHELQIPLHIIERKPKHNPLTFWSVYKICKNAKPDLLHSWSSMSSIFAFPAIKLLNIPLINGNIASAPRDLNYKDRDFFRAKLTFPYSKVVVGNSQAGLAAFKAPAKKSICIPNGFDFHRLEGLEPGHLIKQKYGVVNKQVVGKVAAFAGRKDYDTFIQAAIKVVNLRENVVFFAIGDGPDLDRIKKSVPTSIKKSIIFTGSVNQVESLINIFDLGILSTNIEVHGEGISNSILEYMALGKAVIATEGGGTNEIVVDKETGYLIPPNRPDILASRIIELLDDAKKSKQMGEAGKNRIKKYFDLEKMTDRYLDLYKQLMPQ